MIPPESIYFIHSSNLLYVLGEASSYKASASEIAANASKVEHVNVISDAII